MNVLDIYLGQKTFSAKVMLKMKLKLIQKYLNQKPQKKVVKLLRRRIAPGKKAAVSCLHQYSLSTIQMGTELF